MDPTATLTEIRELAESARLVPEGTGTAYDLAEKVSDLDGWLSNGGFLPEQWQATIHPGRPRRTEDGTVLEGVIHGRRRSYNLGCRCIPCTAANRLKRNLTDAEYDELAYPNGPTHG